MNFEDFIPDALSMVSAWEVPEEDFAQAVNDQARLMAGLDLECKESSTTIWAPNSRAWFMICACSQVVSPASHADLHSIIEFSSPTRLQS